MRDAHEPRLARVAAMVADPARSRMLAYLLGGDCASAGELAQAASVSAATASGHLAKLTDAGFVVCESRGRHRYFRLADVDVAHALEALAVVAERSAHDRAWAHPERQRLRYARCCYGHLAGGLAVALFEGLQAERRLIASGAGFDLSTAGQAWLGRWGFVPGPVDKRRRYAYACMDWSERRDHLAGQLADELYRHFTAKGWLTRAEGRAVRVSVAGEREWLPGLAATVVPWHDGASSTARETPKRTAAE